MNSASLAFKYVFKNTNKITMQFRHFGSSKVLTRQNLRFKDHLYKYSGESPLWFTNLPCRKRRALSLIDKKKVNIKKMLPTGPVIIECKNKNLNHYSGMNYGKFDPVPLASKGWGHRKSVGDYFTILPTSEHPAFLWNSSDGPAASNFREFGIDNKIVENLKKMNIHVPTSIQSKGITSVLSGKNVLIVSETGCGKTLTYLVPMVQMVLKWKSETHRALNSPYSVIVVPTRELAMQIGIVAQKLCSELDVKCLTLVGGKLQDMLLEPIYRDVDILIGSFQTIKKLFSWKHYSTDLCKQIVLDEADTLLDDSFNDDLRSFLFKTKLSFVDPEMENVSNRTQLCLVSATLPTSLESCLEGIMSVDALHTESTVYVHKIQPHVPQKFIRIRKSQKPEKLLEIIKKNESTKTPTIIFSNKRTTSNWMNYFLSSNNVKSGTINKSLFSEERMKQYQMFKNGQINIVSCTDCASRGLDFTWVKCVINYDFPKFMADYVHRCGRTGRIGHVKNCSIINFISSKAELKLLQEIELAARTETQLKNVNNNITRIIQKKIMSN